MRVISGPRCPPTVFTTANVCIFIGGAAAHRSDAREGATLQLSVDLISLDRRSSAA
jgi:hypothetical protein